MHRFLKLYFGNETTCFGQFLCPSSGVIHCTLSSGICHTGYADCLTSNLPPTWPGMATLEEGCCSDTMTCTRGCSYSFMYSWWWVLWTPETCRAILQ